MNVHYILAQAAGSGGAERRQRPTAKRSGESVSESVHRKEKESNFQKSFSYFRNMNRMANVHYQQVFSKNSSHGNFIIITLVG